MRNWTDNHFGRRNELARKMTMSHNHTTHQPVRFSVRRLRIDYFHFRFPMDVYERPKLIFAPARFFACHDALPARRIPLGADGSPTRSRSSRTGAAPPYNQFRP